MPSSLVRTMGALVTAGLSIACGGDDSPTTPSPDPPSGPTRTVKAQPSFTTDIEEIFARRGCTQAQCHGASPGQANMNLSQGAAYDQIVNVPSTSESTFNRITPDSADVSYLVMKIENRQNVGTAMPPPSGGLDTIDINNIRNWVNNSAPRN